MVIPSLEDCIAGRQRERTLQGAREQEWNQIRRAIRGGEEGGAINRVMREERKDVISSARKAGAMTME
jgi:hypothetical protein